MYMMQITTETKKIYAFITTLFLISLFCLPVFAVAAQDPATIGNTGITYECTNGECTFADLIAASENIVVFMRNIALLFSVVVIAYAGFLYLTSGGQQAARSKANGMLLNGVIGIVIILCSWLIVHLIVSALVSPSVLQNSAVTV